MRACYTSRAMDSSVNRSSLRLLHPGLLVLVGSLAAGCGGSSTAPPPPPPPVVVIHDTPQSTMAAFQHTYEFKDAAGFASLLAGDFYYSFSVAADPTLAAQYGSDWKRENEILSATHLFSGFTPSSSGIPMPGAEFIAMTLVSPQYFDDPAHADSADYYKWVTVERVVMSIEIPTTPEPVIYNIDSRHEFYLVRGDAAVLVAGQPATSNTWYIRRWDDLAVNFALARTRIAGDPSTPAAPASWGRIKVTYYN